MGNKFVVIKLPFEWRNVNIDGSGAISDSKSVITQQGDFDVDNTNYC